MPLITKRLPVAMHWLNFAVSIMTNDLNPKMIIQMKTMMLALVAQFFVATGAFAGEEKSINYKALQSFKQEFQTATNVTWEKAAEYLKAEFDLNGRKLNAFYSLDGELLGITRNITITEVPISLQLQLKKEYNNLWISDLFEVTKNEETKYYITLEGANKKQIMTSLGQGWILFKKLTKD